MSAEKTISIKVTEKVFNLLKELSKKEIAGHDPEFNAMDYSGGNFDDAYELGIRDGERELAQMIMGDTVEST